MIINHNLKSLRTFKFKRPFNSFHFNNRSISIPVKEKRVSIRRLIFRSIYKIPNSYPKRTISKFHKNREKWYVRYPADKSFLSYHRTIPFQFHPKLQYYIAKYDIYTRHYMLVVVR